MDGAVYTQHLPNGTSFDLIRVEGGSFFIGNSDHEIHVPTFYMAKYPVTQALWKAVVSKINPSTFGGNNRPVEQVSWNDAAAFCNSLNILSGYSPRYFTDGNFRYSLNFKMAKSIKFPDSVPIFIDPLHFGYRLPSELIWEYTAIGAQQKGQFRYAGGNNLDELGWHHENSHLQTHSVGLKLPNQLGIYDLNGNVWEWCEDNWREESYHVLFDIKSDSDFLKTIRGGCYWVREQEFDLYTRSAAFPEQRTNPIGFRVSFFAHSHN